MPEEPERVERETTRVCDRLRTLPLSRLSATRPDGGTRAADAFALAQRLADEAARAESRPTRVLPALPDSTAADVLAVCANDLVEVLRALPHGPVRRDLCRSATEGLVELRRAR